MMKRSEQRFGVFLAVVLALVAVGNSELLFQEDFSGYDVSTGTVALNPAAQVGTFRLANLGNPIIDVRETTLMDGSTGAALLIYDDSTGTDKPYLYADTIDYATTQTKISYNFMLNGAGTNTVATFAQTAGGDTTYNKLQRVNSTECYQSFYQSGTGGVGTYLSNNTWYTMVMEMPAMPYKGTFDWKATILDSSGAEVYANNSITSYSASAGPAPIGSFLFTNPGVSDVTNVWLDDIKIETAPDPLPLKEGSWTMVVLPDTQDYYAYNTTDSLAAVNSQVDWILANQQSRNIGLVLHEGDIVSRNDNLVQWEQAQNTIRRLDGHVPYILSTGNHEYQNDSGPDTRESTLLNTYFKASDNPLNDPASGGILKGFFADGELENTYSEFTAPDGRKMLIFSLEFGPRQAVVDWANDIAGCEEYGDYTAVLLTHAYMYNDDTRYDWAAKGRTQDANPHVYSDINSDTHDGEELWNELVRGNENFELVFSGHTIGLAPRTDESGVGTLTSENDAGGLVHQMLFNAQYLPLGGDGWLRLIEFCPDGLVQVKTYSPWLGEWRTESYDQFTLQISVPEPGCLFVMLGGGVVLLRRRFSKCP